MSEPTQTAFGPWALIAVAVVVGGMTAASSCADLTATDPDRVRQGGDLTVFDSTSKAYDLASPPVREDPGLLDRFMKGDLLYDQDRVASPAVVPGTGGLGPLYVGRSCATCHQDAGRTKSTLFTHGGTGFDFSTFLAFMRTRNGQYFREYGRVLHDHATFGSVPEGRLQVEYDERCGVFPTEDQEPYCLIKPRYRLTDLYASDIREEDLVLSVRTPLRHVGLGLFMAVDRDELRRLAATSYPEFGITPKLQWVFERNRWDVGISGHKAHHLDLTVELGFLSDMGVTSPRFPDEICEGQSQHLQDFGVEISSEDLAAVDFYLHTSSVPARRNVDDPQVRRGERMFYEAKCQLCHTPTLHTGPDAPTLIDGTRLPFLANQKFHPYTDLLLHDMGPELGDDFSQFEATGDEWRTAPLWGIGLQEIVNGHSHFLHDGRARNLTEAILWHREAEGAASYNLFVNMPKADRDALLAFLRSL